MRFFNLVVVEKYAIIFSFIIIYLYIYKISYGIERKLNEEYLQFKAGLNINFNNNINKIIRIGIYTISISDGGLQRITSIIINFLDNIKIFKIYLFSIKEKEENEYSISDNIKRIVIKNIKDTKDLVKKLKKKR